MYTFLIVQYKKIWKILYNSQFSVANKQKFPNHERFLEQETVYIY